MGCGVALTQLLSPGVPRAPTSGYPTYDRSMRRLLLLAALVAVVVWRNRRLTELDRIHGFGPYAKVIPVVDS